MAHRDKKHSRYKIRRSRLIGLKRAERRRTVRRRLRQRRFEAGTHPDIVRRQVRLNTGSTTREIELPADFCLISNHDTTLRFFRQLEDAFDDSNVSSIQVDHTTVQTIGIEAALLLIAEFERLTSYAPKIKLLGILKGMCESARSLLDGIGYFSFYREGDPEPHRRVDNHTQYFEITTGKGSDTKASGTLVEAFANGGYIPQQTARRLGKCLGECLDNVSHHAYNGNRFRPLKRRWWIVGYCDKPKNEIYFALLDLGVGMPHTLKKRRREADMSVKQILFGLNDEELIVRAFTQHFSSTKKGNRGLGLPGLKNILDKFGQGELNVFSSRSGCTLTPGNPPRGKRYEIPLAGTLLTWKLTSQPTFAQ
jgi:hypothetical protein